MIFRPTALHGVVVIEPDRLGDDRGFFARTWCQREFAEHGLNPRLVQCSLSFNRRRGTLRGMHYQESPHVEAKLIRCSRGGIWDVVLDLRAGSLTFGQHNGIELTSDNHLMMYVPEGCAHGFQTLVDNTEVSYQMSEFYTPGAACGVRYNDPAFGIQWPIPDPVLLERDRRYPDFAAALR